MRGEKRPHAISFALIMGSPPHARGKAGQSAKHQFVKGITPACAGKRHGAELRQQLVEDHPRMRGEKLWLLRLPFFQTGSPPHARGKGYSRRPAR